MSAEKGWCALQFFGTKLGAVLQMAHDLAPHDLQHQRVNRSGCTALIARSGIDFDVTWRFVDHRLREAAAGHRQGC
jgi:hypothetical protein